MNDERPHASRALLLTGRWFGALPEPLREALLSLARVRTLRAGERLFSRGDPPCGLYCVLEGSIRASGVSESGREALLTLVEPPAWFGEISLFDGQPRTHDAVAEGATRVLQVPQAELLALLAERPEWWRELALLLCHKLRLAFVALEDLSLLPSAARLAHRLVLMAEGYGGLREGERRVLDVSQEQLARMLALSRQTTNQILKDLEARGLVQLTYGRIELRDLAGLRAAAQDALR
ncbi:Crp/Fnr family transcriptional regulator [Aggregicoccus sp. 17bor-14]|uniref:Crp/Fnr family transcriptional regulator n=1 Tax=Myxococcaceae TaxID=31 RepID=UPI00129C3E33|nr:MULTISPECIES: Crp/Fnr family transcriptional regulator [Myxococcaceae]MBF5042372.1 Crp/Fnr family transcriptional regulator [Simulacricoccus sp. 17bor-14]MRI88145.1 Crp/Fnr family transcriptional regulator [Aggregicoccus sp. 17bor-14]